MKTQQITLRLFSYALSIGIGLIAAANSFQNAKRASHGCGEYSSNFVLSSAITEATTMLIPTLILLFLIFLSWQRTSSRISIVLITFAYSIFVFYTFLSDFTNAYAPCDRKGDESSLFIIILGVFYLPITWLALTATLEVISYVYFLSKNQIFRRK
jgi:uncharacterized membrane protein YidH (DUF202 family)